MPMSAFVPPPDFAAAPASAASPFERADWWDAAGPFRMLHAINPLRLQWLTAQVGGALRGARLLDVGCGGGIFAAAAARAGAKVCGTDSAAAAIAAARAHAKKSGLSIDYVCGDGLSALPPRQYDIITCFEMLEHTAQPDALVADIAARLAPRGLAAFSTINRTPQAWLLMIVALEHLARQIPRGTHQFERFIKPDELARWCRSQHLTVTDVCGMTYSPFGHFFRLHPHNTGVNYFIAARRGD